jgi:hypothetical protein
VYTIHGINLNLNVREKELTSSMTNYFYMYMRRYQDVVGKHLPVHLSFVTFVHHSAFIMGASNSKTTFGTVQGTSDLGVITGFRLRLWSNNTSDPVDPSAIYWCGFQYTKDGVDTVYTFAGEQGYSKKNDGTFETNNDNMWDNDVNNALQYMSALPPGRFIVNITLNLPAPYTPATKQVNGGTVNVPPTPDEILARSIVFTDDAGTKYSFIHDWYHSQGPLQQTVSRPSDRTVAMQPFKVLYTGANGYTDPVMQWQLQPPTINTVRSTVSRPATLMNSTSLVTFINSDPIALFADRNSAAVPHMDFGTHTLTISAGDVSNGNLSAMAESCTLTFDDVAVNGNGLVTSAVKDFTGLSYASLNNFDAVTPLVIHTSSNLGVFELRRALTPVSHITLACKNASFATNNVWTVAVTSQNYLSSAAPPPTSSVTNVVSLFELVENGGAGAGTWTSNATVPRLLTLKSDRNTTPSNTFVTLPVDQQGAFSLSPGVYQVRWKVPGLAVDSFVSWIEHIHVAGDFDAAVLPASFPANVRSDVYLGSVAYSPSAASSNIDYSMGEVIIEVGSSASTNSGALFKLQSLAQTTSVIQGKGMLLSDSFKNEFFVSTVQQDILSSVQITRYVA